MAEYSTSIDIEASPELVFAYLTEPERMVLWMGDRAELNPFNGGGFAVDIRGNSFRGEYLEVEPPHRVVVSWGLAGSDDFPPGASRVEFVLSATSKGTNLKLLHTNLPESHARTHGLGWTHYLARLNQAAMGIEPGPDTDFTNQRSSAA